MFTADDAILAALLVPVLGAIGIALAHRWPNLREGITLTTAAALLACVLTILPAVLAGARPTANQRKPAPNCCSASCANAAGERVETAIASEQVASL